MSTPPSPTMPGLVSFRTVPDLPTSETVSPAPEVSVSAAVSAVINSDHSALIKIITDLVGQKPTTLAEGMKLMGTLQEKIAEWALSEIPEKDKILAGLKMAETVAASVGCLPCLRK